MEQATLNRYPAPVLDTHSWSWWRKILKTPPESVLNRCKAWDRAIELTGQLHEPARFGLAQSKIFGNSRVYWECMDYHRTDTFNFRNQRHYSTHWSDPRFISPYGPMVLLTKVEEFQCDARSIQGIGASKSDLRQHETMDDFGAYFLAEKNEDRQKYDKPLLGYDETSLQELCRHDQIRIINSVGIDSFSVRAWDGRLFLDNAGGSHHLAAAIHVANRIGKAMPVSETLYLYQLNAKTVRWLVDGFYTILLPNDLAMNVFHIAHDLLEGAVTMEIPGLLGDGAIVAFEKESEIAHILAQILLKQCCLDMGAMLATAMEQQEKFLQHSSLPWDTSQPVQY